MNLFIWFGFFFLLSVISVWLVAKINKSKGITGIDVNKKEKPVLAESTGIGLLLPLWTAITAMIYLKILGNELIYFGLMISLLALIGFFDDSKHKFSVKPMPWIVRAVPVGIISLTFAWLNFPNYSAIPIALFIALLASLENTFAGLNGWEIGSGLIISLATAYVLQGSPLFYLALALSAGILGLLLFNKFPAKVFPGDSGTLLIGSAIAGLMVLNKNTESMIIVLLFFLPHIIDVLALKLLSNPLDMTQQKIPPYSLTEDEKISIPKYIDGKTRYDFAKLIIRIFGPLKEWKAVAVIWAILAVNCMIILLLFKKI